MRKKTMMNKLIRCSAAALLTASLFSFSGQSVKAATRYQRLTHNAYAYNYSGKRANNKLYKKGSKVRVIGSITLNGKKYNIISGNVYIKVSNFNKRRQHALSNGYETQLLRNSYIYNVKGQRIKNTKLRKGHSIICYGNPIKIHSKKYIQIGKGQFVRLNNVLWSYDGPTGSDSLNHTHHNSSDNMSNTTNDNSTINKSTSSNSTTDKKDSNKSDISKKDADKSDQAKSDSKTTSKSTDTKGTNGDSQDIGKDDSKNNSGLATEADYLALSKALKKADNIKNSNHASWAKRNTYSEAYRKANSLLLTYKFNTPTASSADVQKAISDLNTAANNLDGDAIESKMPKVTIEVSPDNMYKVIWDNDSQKQTVLDIVNEIFGSNDARFVRMSGDTEIALTNKGIPNCEFSTSDFVKATYIYK